MPQPETVKGLTLTASMIRASLSGSKRMGAVLSLPLSLLLLNACTTAQPKVNVTQTLQPNCAVTEDRKVTYKQETLGEYSIISDFSSACANLQVLTLLAKSNENDAVGQISSIALLKMLSDSDEKIKNVILQTLYDQKKTPRDLVHAQTVYYLLKISDKKNLSYTRAAAAGNLLDFYYSETGQAHLAVEDRRAAIEETLRQRNTSLEKIDLVFSRLVGTPQDGTSLNPSIVPHQIKRKVFCKVEEVKVSESGGKQAVAICSDSNPAPRNSF